MAIPSFAYRASVYSTSGASSYATTGTYTPGANHLLIAFVLGCSTSVVDPNGATPFAGHGVSWTKLTLTANGISTTHALSVWVANSGASPSSAACTAQWATNRTGGAIIEFEVTDADVSGGAAAAILQNPTNTGSGSGSSLASAMTQTSPNTRPIAFNVHLTNEATTPKASPAWTEEANADGNFNNPASGIEAEWIVSQWDGSPTASWSGSSAWRMVALEIKNLPSTYNESTSLGVSGAITTVHNANLRPVFSLGLAGGISPTASRIYQDSVSLASALGISANGGKAVQCNASLGASLDLALAAGGSQYNGAFALGAALPITVTPAVNTSRALAFAANAGITAYEALTLINDWLVNLAAGEDAPHGMVFAEGFIFIGLRTAPGKLLRVDPADPGNYDVVTFDSDGQHDTVQDLLYIPSKAKLYCLLSEQFRCVVVEVDPQTLAVTTVINDTVTPCGVTAGSFCNDATYLYVLTFQDSPSAVIRYQLSDWSRISSINVNVDANYRFGHCLRYDGVNIYGSGTIFTPPYDSWVIRIDPSTFNVVDTGIVPGGVTDDACFTVDYVWYALEGAGKHHVVRVSKSNLSSYTLIDVRGPSYGTFFDGQYVLALLYGTTGVLARIFPDDLSVKCYQFPANQAAPNEFCRNGEQVYFTFYDAAQEKVSGLSRSEYGAFAPSLTFGASVNAALLTRLDAQAQAALAVLLSITASLPSGLGSGGLYGKIFWSYLGLFGSVTGNIFNEGFSLATSGGLAAARVATLPGSMTLGASVGMTDAAKADLLATFAFGVAASYASAAQAALQAVQNLSASLGISHTSQMAALAAFNVAAAGGTALTAKADFRPAILLGTGASIAVAGGLTFQATLPLGTGLSISAVRVLTIPALLSLGASVGIADTARLDARAAFVCAVTAGLTASARMNFASYLSVAASFGISVSLAQNIYQVALDLAVSGGMALAARADFRPAVSLGAQAGLAAPGNLNIGVSVALGAAAGMAAAGRLNLQGYLAIAAALGINASLAQQAYYEGLALGVSLGYAPVATGSLGAAIAVATAGGLTVAPSVAMARSFTLSSSVGLSGSKYLSFANALALGLAGGTAVAPRLDANPVVALGAAAGLSVAAQADFQAAALLAVQAGCSLAAFGSFVRTFTLAASLGLDAFSVAGILPTPTDYLDAAYGVEESLNAVYRVTENLQASFGPTDRLEAWF